MMGPEAMGYTPVNVDWWSEKVCRNFLFGTCPHLIFTNTVCRQRLLFAKEALTRIPVRKWISARAPSCTAIAF